MSQFLGRQGLIIIILLIAMVTDRMNNIEQLKQIVVFGLPAVVIALSFHEFAHAYMAVKLGDDTPKIQGRMSLDIRNHIDPIGLIIFIFAGFGWAKPVMTDPRNLKNPKKDMALIAAAGPIMNIIIAITTIIIFEKTGMLMSEKLQILFSYIFMYNASFAVFNLIPIAPLDGSKIIKAFLPNKIYIKFTQFEYKYQFALMMSLLALIFLFEKQFGIFIFFFVDQIAKIGTLIASYLPF